MISANSNSGPSEKDFLFALIKSLDEREYGFVLSFARKGKYKATQKEKLLSDMRKQKEYNPKLLRPKYKQYNVLRFHLKNMIFQALRLFHEEANADQRIEIHIRNEMILYQKGFFHESEREYNRAIGLAIEYQNLGMILKLYQIKIFRVQELKTRDLVPVIKNLCTEIMSVLGIYSQQLKAFQTYQELFAAYRTEDGSSPEPIDQASSLKPDEIDFYRQFYIHSADGLKAHLNGDIHQAILITEKMVKLFEDVPAIKEENHLKYKVLLSNLGVLSIGVQDYDKVAEIIEKFKSGKENTFNEEAEVFQNLIHLELLLMVNEKKYEGAEDLTQRAEAGMTKYGAKVNAARKLSIWYNLLLLYMIKEDYRAAHKMVNQIIDHKRLQVRKEVQYTTRLLELIIYFELELWEYSRPKFTALSKYLERKGRKTEFKYAVIKHMRSLVESAEQKQVQIYQKLEEALFKLASDDDNEDKLGLTLVAAWTASKLGRGSVRDCLQEIS